MATLTTKQFVARQRKRLKELEKGKPLAIAATSTHSIQMNRVFIKGENSAGGKIGNYNTTDELYVNPKNAPKNFKPKGKHGNASFKSGKPHKTGFFRSYKDFRNQQGRQTNTVDLILFGNLRSDISKPPFRKAPNIYQTGTTRNENSLKVSGQEERYGRIFALTIQERKQFTKTLEIERAKIGV